MLTNDMLTNDIISFEQLGPGGQIYAFRKFRYDAFYNHKILLFFISPQKIQVLTQIVSLRFP